MSHAAPLQSLNTAPCPSLQTHPIPAASCFTVLNANESLAFVLADAGFDVWMGAGCSHGMGWALARRLAGEAHAPGGRAGGRVAQEGRAGGGPGSAAARPLHVS